jgi:hypothetical protein
MNLAKEKPDWIDMISPATLTAMKRTFTKNPIARPINTSFITKSSKKYGSLLNERSTAIESKRRYAIRRDNPALNGTDTALDEKRGSSQRIEATLAKISKNLCMSAEKSIVFYFTYAGMFENRFTV